MRLRKSIGMNAPVVGPPAEIRNLLHFVMELQPIKGRFVGWHCAQALSRQRSRTTSSNSSGQIVCRYCCNRRLPLQFL